MEIDSALEDHISIAFLPLNNDAAIRAFPPPAALADALEKAIPAGTGVTSATVGPKVAKMFTTAAVNIWMRGVHSFLISAALTDVSPLWSSVAGYYSSHYSVRAIAHLLGFFQLFSAKKIVRLEVQNGHFICTFNPKNARDREHKFYWQIVKKDPHFAADPFFSEYNPDESDVAHRHRANYADHLPGFPIIRALETGTLKERVEKISRIQFDSPPIPLVSRYPDLESVQIIAYHRLVRFRDLVDTIVGDSNRFWSVYRNPAWARDFMDFQLTEQPGLGSQFTLQ